MKDDLFCLRWPRVAQNAAGPRRINEFPLTVFHSVRTDLHPVESSWNGTNTDTLRVRPHRPSLIVLCVYVRVVCDRGLSRIQETGGINTRGLRRSSLASLCEPHNPSVNTPRERLLLWTASLSLRDRLGSTGTTGRQQQVISSNRFGWCCEVDALSLHLPGYREDNKLCSCHFGHLDDPPSPTFLNTFDYQCNYAVLYKWGAYKFELSSLSLELLQFDFKPRSLAVLMWSLVCKTHQEREKRSPLRVSFVFVYTNCCHWVVLISRVYILCMLTFFFLAVLWQTPTFYDKWGCQRNV